MQNKNVNRISKGFWIWGNFLPSETIFLNSLKEKVNSHLISPNFEIHITLSGPYYEIDDNFINQIKNYCKNNSSINIKLTGYDHKQEIYESFYISVMKSSEINRIRNNLFELKNYSKHKEFTPHISLAYGDHNRKLKEELILKLPKLPLSLTLNQLSIAIVDENIEKWEIHSRFRFNKI